MSPNNRRVTRLFSKQAFSMLNGHLVMSKALNSRFKGEGLLGLPLAGKEARGVRQEDLRRTREAQPADILFSHLKMNGS
ncbi:MAG: hypothetical protein JRN37_10090 [Nitrososphaerota archaeon]|jgi:hypothetical protein|nr:hypothetical protein [Nitrososphaerota archaeon]MDG7039477.1 hypothetical protein [Nitrososphaerota archaeon]MDG7040908.1 hypothetical protein [Nitrososphaerota archaeon]